MSVNGDELPSEVWELREVLQWADLAKPADSGFKVLSNESAIIFKKDWVPQNRDWSRQLYIGTRKFDDGARVILLDILSVRRIAEECQEVTGGAFTLPPSRSSTEYVNFYSLPIKTRAGYHQKMIMLSRGNLKRAEIAQKRAQMLREAKDLTRSRGRGGGNTYVVAVCVGVSEASKPKPKPVLDIGRAKWRVGDPVGKINSTFIRIKEHQHIRNSRFVPDRADDFAHGDTELMPFELARNELLDAFDLRNANDKLVFIANAIHHPVRVLDLQPTLSAKQATELDVGKMFRAEKRDQGIKSTLKDMLEHYRAPYDDNLLHNTGNDARYILQLYLAMTKGSK